MAMNNPHPNNNSVKAAEDLLQEMKQRAADAHRSNDAFMMGVMTQILKLVSPVVNKAIARANREDLAQINADHKKLREQSRAERESQRARNRDELPHLTRE